MEKPTPTNSGNPGGAELISAIKQAVLDGARSARSEAPDEVALGTIAAKVLARCAETPLGLAYVAGRNWAIDRDRAEEVSETIERNLVVHSTTQITPELRSEFLRISLDLARCSTEAQVRNLQIFRTVFLEGWGMPELRAAHPAMSDDYIAQSKRRGFTAIYKVASPELRAVLTTAKVGSRFTREVAAGSTVVEASGLHGSQWAAAQRRGCPKVAKEGMRKPSIRPPF